MKLNKAIAIPAVALTAGLSLAACGTTSATPVASSPSSSAPAAAHSAKPAATKTPAPSTGKVGDTFHASDSSSDINVTLVKIIDPAQGADQYTTPDAHKHFVGAVFTIKANAAYSDDANNAATITGSDGQTYSADFSDIAGYTNFNSGTVKLAAGESSTGVVVFQVPDGVTIANVKYDVSGGFASGSVPTWTP
jgi:hypothetical protein